MVLLVLASLVLGWALLSVGAAVVCGRAFAAGSQRPETRLRPDDLELAA